MFPAIQTYDLDDIICIIITSNVHKDSTFLLTYDEVNAYTTSYYRNIIKLSL